MTYSVAAREERYIARSLSCGLTCCEPAARAIQGPRAQRRSEFACQFASLEPARCSRSARSCRGDASAAVAQA
jgi:hypothetical protein